MLMGINMKVNGKTMTKQKVNSLLKSLGVCEYKNGDRYKGEWKDNERNKGILFVK